MRNNKNEFRFSIRSLVSGRCQRRWGRGIESRVYQVHATIRCARKVDNQKFRSLSAARCRAIGDVIIGGKNLGQGNLRKPTGQSALRDCGTLRSGTEYGVQGFSSYDASDSECDSDSVTVTVIHTFKRTTYTYIRILTVTLKIGHESLVQADCNFIGAEQWNFLHNRFCFALVTTIR